jgi:hypothetical protein
MNEHTFRERLQACLDERRDPLDDPELAAFAAAQPQCLELLVALRADARELGALRLAPPRRRLRKQVLAACCAVAAAALVAVVLLRRGAPARPSAPAGRILAASLEELRPRAHAAARATARELLVATPTHSLTTWTTWSEPR